VFGPGQWPDHEHSVCNCCQCLCNIRIYDCIVYNAPLYVYCRGPGSSEGIATDYGLDGPGSNPGGGRDCPYPSRPALGPPSLLYNGYRAFPGGKVRPGRAADHSPPPSAAAMEE